MNHDRDAAAAGPPLAGLIDRGDALDRLDGDEELLDELLRIFRDDAPAMLRRLEETGAGLDDHALERAAHSVKGASATISARSVSAFAADVERLAREGRRDEARARLPELRRELERLHHALDAALGRKAA